MDNTEFKLLLETYKKTIITESDINDIVPDLVYMAAHYSSDDLTSVASVQYNDIDQFLRGEIGDYMSSKVFKKYAKEVKKYAKEQGIK